MASSKIWAMRMPGGPSRIVKSERELTEEQAKKAYEGSFAKKHAKCLLDKEAVWPLCKPITQEEMTAKYSALLQPSLRTGLAKNLVEVELPGKAEKKKPAAAGV